MFVNANEREAIYEPVLVFWGNETFNVLVYGGVGGSSCCLLTFPVQLSDHGTLGLAFP